MTESQHSSSAPFPADAAQSAPKRFLHNLDVPSVVAFLGAGLFGFIGVANNVRHIFWHNFIDGFGYIKTPFSAIKDKYAARFKQTPLDYAAGLLTADQYRDAMRNHAHDFRTEVNTKLLKEFHIPSDGIEGWTVGTVKRFKEVGLSGKFHSAVGFATVAAVSIGAVSLLRHNRNMLNTIDDKLDALHQDFSQQQSRA